MRNIIKLSHLLYILIIFFCVCFQTTYTQHNVNSRTLNQSPDIKSPGYSINNADKSSEISTADFLPGTRAFIQYFANFPSTIQLGKSFMESCSVTDFGPPREINLPGGLVFVNGSLFTWNQNSPYQLWKIDTVTGSHTLLFNITGVPQALLSGLTWDGTTMYGISTNSSSSQISRINLSTGVCTPIGVSSSISPGSMSISGLLGYDRGLFSIDALNDNLVRWDKFTGIPTLIGPLGVTTSNFTDAQFDNYDGKLYWISVISGGRVALRTIDTATGNSIELCQYPFVQGSGIAFYSPTFRNYNEVIHAPINIQIDDYTLISDSVLFPFQGSGSIVINVNYRIINLTHTWDADLRMYAQHQNTGAMIVNWVGGSGDNFINTVLSDSAVIPIASGVAPFDGFFKPSNPLNVFNGLSPNGYWKLLVSDSAAGDTGVLTGWSIQVTYQNPTGGINTVEIPNYYSLGQNYPNPFNPSTKIKFTLPQAGNVKLTVYDILGREIRTLVNEVRDAGVHEVSFNASSLSSGVYFYRIEAGKYTATKKMLLIK